MTQQLVAINSKSDFDRFYEIKLGEIISPFNENYKEIIRDMLIDYIKMGHFNVQAVIDEIRVINFQISEQIAQASIDAGIVTTYWDDDDDYTQMITDTSDDILDDIFFQKDILTEIQQMIYDTAQEYNIPLLMRKDMFFEFPEILSMYSNKANVINMLPDNVEASVHSNHAQLVMFDELLDCEPVLYGRNNVLIFDETEENKSKVNLLEG